jgi:LysM repeat protein
MKKVIKLTESDLRKIIERVISEQSYSWDNNPPIETQMKTIKPDAGGKYCFSTQMAQRLRKESGLSHILYKVKKGDVLSKLIQKNGGPANSIYSIEYDNDLCPEIKKGIIKAGDVLALSTFPDGSYNY